MERIVGKGRKGRKEEGIGVVMEHFIGNLVN
jgi:hypothetical protein